MKPANDLSCDIRLENRGAEVLARLVKQEAGFIIKRILVVGCGSGIEAAVLAKALDAVVVGIDLRTDFDSEASRVVDLKQGDATCIDFANGRFDMVYSYHALEHISNYRKALLEMRRVLKEGGLYCVGTPNRSRLIGYLGSQKTSLSQKLRWNIADWKAKITGRFRNDLGAHAGFTSKELMRDLRDVFGDAKDITLLYYLLSYRHHRATIRLIDSIGANSLLFPSIYFLGRKRTNCEICSLRP